MPTANAARARAVIADLLAGNERFVTGKARHPAQMLRGLPELQKGQNPKAIVLGCSDSRVPLEILFDVGLGDLFVIRVAGNIASPGVLGSLEFGVSELKIPLILVIGHTKCGAVTGAVNAMRNKTQATGHLESILTAIRPLVTLEEPTVEECIEETMHRNIKAVAETIRTTPPILSDAVAKHELYVVGGCYSLATGRVEMMETVPDPPAQVGETA